MPLLQKIDRSEALLIIGGKACCLPLTLPLLYVLVLLCQVEGVGAAAGREVVMSWLAAAAAANEGRTAGGEYSALKTISQGKQLAGQMAGCSTLDEIVTGVPHSLTSASFLWFPRK
jgi:hypothetical protein